MTKPDGNGKHTSGTSDEGRAPAQAKTPAPYGSWRTPVTAELVASDSVNLYTLQVSGDDVFWVEMRPLEDGRYVIVRRASDGTIADVTPPATSARTLVHEYGGGTYVLHGATVIFSDFDDQRLYRQDLQDEPRAGTAQYGPPVPITPAPLVARGLRYADGRITPDGRLLVCVRERHEPDGAVINELVTLPADGTATPVVIAGGHDFYSSPRISHDGRRLVWISWDHPSMPWDDTELWAADLEPDGTLRNERLVAGGPGESVVQPQWSPDDVLHFVSDRSGWWNLYRETGEGAAALAPLAAEFAEPHWVFGLSNYSFLPDGRIVCFYSQRGFDRLAVVSAEGRLDPIPCDYTVLGDLTTIGTTIWALGASPTQGNSVLRISLDGAAEAMRHSQKHEMDPQYISSPEAIEFPTENGLTAHALFYRPANKDFAGPAGERPPLIVISHGGPTSAADSSLDLEIQFWTSHGFALVDVNYGGSSGYGRPYRDRLKGQWGVIDTDDCISAARFLVERGDGDPDRVAVRGGSAGGYTTLNALTQRRFFSAGASYFGLADLEMFVTGGTHKFEERYLISLVGPYPEAKELYRQRSPINFVDQIDCPVIVFQGLEDAIVPPEQAEIIVAAMAKKGLPHAYLAFAGEQHGFRKAASIVRSLEAELYFYGRVFGFTPAEHIEPIEIKNL